MLKVGVLPSFSPLAIFHIVIHDIQSFLKICHKTGPLHVWEADMTLFVFSYSIYLALHPYASGP